MFKHVLRGIGRKNVEKETETQQSSNQTAVTSYEKESIGNFLWKPYYGLIPIHVCGHSIATLPTRVVGWALKPFGFQEIPVKVFKEDNKTIIQIETGKEWLVYECGQMWGWALRPFRITENLPVKVFRDGSKSIIQIEAVDGIFCDCNLENRTTSENQTAVENTDLQSLSTLSETQTLKKEDIEEEMIARSYENLLNDFIKFTEEEEQFLNRRASIRRSFNAPQKKRRRRPRSSSLSNMKTIMERNIETNNNNVEIISIESEETDDLDSLLPRPALDVDVKSSLRKKSRINQSLENFKNTFSSMSPKLRRPRKKRTKRTSSLIIVL